MPVITEYLKIKDDLCCPDKHLKRNADSFHMTVLFTHSNLVNVIEVIEVKLQKEENRGRRNIISTLREEKTNVRSSVEEVEEADQTMTLIWNK